METMLKPARGGEKDVLDKDASATPLGGVNDTYGEDAATEDLPVTPWARMVARSLFLLWMFPWLMSIRTFFFSFLSTLKTSTFGCTQDEHYMCWRSMYTEGHTAGKWEYLQGIVLLCMFWCSLPCVCLFPLVFT
jgi:hypothetical protein